MIKSADGYETTVTDPSRILTIGGSITEIVYALGMGDQVISVDVSSTFPPEIHQLPKSPYIRSLAAEGILSLRPSLVITTDEAEPKTAIQQMREAQTDVLMIKDEESFEGMAHKVHAIAKALGVKEKGEALVEKNRVQFDEARQIQSRISRKPTVLFVLALRGTGEFTVAGANTGAKSIIELAGGVNAFNDFEGYKPVTSESILQANPDFIIYMKHRSENIESNIREHAVVKLTTAVKNDQLIYMDGNYLLGFGPRLGSAVLELMEYFHPDQFTSLNK
ncbi:MAG: ABC transporter substrate-binding protein [Bacteroidota bacterium]